ncbi:hypothetical protein A2635_02790 [Candidatus Peribacteria bacterium RIFCSPHIGHO2_01_FULL_51_9]|nr:MAG: hypothetical protein A2635_02790 [Candidatus Peribacteria bacterium RIFCSPHIGHO2_01_FULL_51_9]
MTSGFQWVGGGTLGESHFIIARWIFLRAMGVIYLIAFLSLWVQIRGLIGSHGILPVQDFLDAVREHVGPDRFRLLPTIFWVSASDAALHIVCGLGVLSALLLIFNVLPLASAIVLWALYLSLFNVGQDFLSFQWDTLLLETGFLTIFLVPWGILPGLGVALSPLIILLFWWLLFRFMFESGVVKLTSGDTSWRDLTALTYHYFTQPLPTWTAWYMHQMPAAFHKFSTLFTYGIELALPFLIFTSRIPRLIACIGFVLLQIIIFSTGNYNFFNLLTVALSLLLIDDRMWVQVLPQRLVEWISPIAATEILPQWFAGIISVIAIVIILVSGFQLLRTLARGVPMPRFIEVLETWIDPFRSVHSYGLFRVMTKTRPEIIIEGSSDGEHWKSYEFRWKPGDPTRRPAFIEPHQPRLDWQMWFAALGNFRTTPWFHSLLFGLLKGSDEIHGLLKENPFPSNPPKFIRAVLYEYTFTDMKERKATGAWWKRTYKGLYAPALSLR